MSKRTSDKQEKGKITIIRHKEPPVMKKEEELYPNKEAQREDPKPSNESPKEEKALSPGLPPSLVMSDILNEDERLLFSLKIIGDLQKNEKLMEKNGLPSVDDRYFQTFARWYSGDGRQKTSDMIHQLAKETRQRVQSLLDEDYESRLQSLKNRERAMMKETPEEKKYREECEDRRRKITGFFENLSKAKQGVENLKDTYNDKYIKGRLGIALSNMDETLEKLRKIQ